MTSDAGDALGALRPTLFRIARLHLRNDAWAEDAVAETMLAAVESRRAFDGRSRYGTWVVGILKHKIIDVLRARSREAPLADVADDGFEDEIFQPDGHYREAPVEWESPEDRLSRVQFFEVLETCVEGLPAAQARIFMLREWLDCTTDEICKELAITPTNAGVLLHRARMRLRECLELRWFRSVAP